MSSEDIAKMTGFKNKNLQVSKLKDLGFVRAYKNRLGEVVLERPHYEAVCTGTYNKATLPISITPSRVKTDFMKNRSKKPVVTPKQTQQPSLANLEF